MKKVLLVDDNLNVLHSFMRSLHSSNYLWSVVTAESAANALEIMASEKIDVIVSDLRMPGMDGVELLGIVAQKFPATLRIAITGDADPHLCQQATLVAHQFIAKPCSTQEIARIINKAVEVNSLVMNTEIKTRILKMANLPSQPGLYIRLMDELNRPEVELDNISAVVSQDISMTAKILQLVNSAYFGLAREVSEVSQAVFLLGMETIRDLAFSIHLFSQFDQTLIERAGLENLWDHSLRVATCSRAIVSSMGCDKKLITSSFTAGMLHDIGKLILGTTAPFLYRSLTRSGIACTDQILPKEKEKFGSNHAEVGAFLLGTWGLPVEIIDAVLTHHNYAGLSFEGLSPSIAVWYANAFVNEFNNQKKTIGFQLTSEMQNNSFLTNIIDSWNEKCLQVIMK